MTEPQSDLLLSPDKIVSDLRLLAQCAPYGIPQELEPRIFYHLARILAGIPMKGPDGKTIEGAEPPREREVRAAIRALDAMKRFNLEFAKTALGMDTVRERLAIALQVNVGPQQVDYYDLLQRTAQWTAEALADAERGAVGHDPDGPGDPPGSGGNGGQGPD